MMSLTFNFCYAVISLQLEVGTIIICLVVGGISGFEDKLADLVVSKKMCGPIIKVSVTAVKEEDLWIQISSSTDTTEDTCCLHPFIPVHLS